MDKMLLRVKSLVKVISARTFGSLKKTRKLVGNDG